jgi:hypothetical protein
LSSHMTFLSTLLILNCFIFSFMMVIEMEGCILLPAH